MSKIVKLLVIIDMGHGGSDPGTSGNGVIEKIANYNTGIALKEFLEKQGVKVILTRTGDNTMSLEARTNYANKVAKENPRYKVVFISVHHNAGSGDRGEYIHSIYEGDSKALATAIGDIMNSKLGQQKKIYSKKSTTTNKDYYHVIRATSMPAIIVEVAFLDNKADVQICDTPEEQKRNGRIIGEGVLNWAGINKSSIENTQPSKPQQSPKPSTSEKPKALWEVCISGQLVRDLQIELNRQCNAKLVVDGYFGDGTLNKCITVKKGAKGNITKVIQRRLQQLKYSIGKYGSDGDFGKSTYDAVVKFQKTKKLTADGVVGKNTWKALMIK